MVDGDGKAWKISDPERWRARFRIFYQGLRNAELGNESGATLSNIQSYATANPEAAARLRDLQTLERVQVVAGVTGLLAATTSIWRWSKSPPVVIVGGIIAPFAAALVAEDVASLALGTFKYDTAREIEQFHEWVIKRNAEAANQ